MKQGGWHYEFYSAVNQRILDALIGGAAFYLAYQLRFEWQVSPHHELQMWSLLPAVMVGHVLVSSTLGIYRLVWRYVSLKDALMIGRSYLVFSAILMAVRLGLPDRWWLVRTPRSVIVIEFLLALFGALGARAFRRMICDSPLGGKPSGKERRRVLLIGAGRAGVQVAREIASRADIRPVGFLDDDPKKNETVIGGLRVLGAVSSLESIVRQHDVQEVVICIPRVARDTLKKIWALSEPVSVPVKIMPAIEEILEKKTSIALLRDAELADLLGRDTVNLSLEDPEVAAAYRSKQILITGAGGSIGSELACQLSSLKPGRLVLLDKDENGLHDACLRLRALPDGPEVHPVVADLRFPERLAEVFFRFRPEVVFHAAAHKHVHLMEMNPCEAILNNVIGTHNLVERALESGVSRFVLISTDKAVKPTCIMGASKRLCEMIVQAHVSNGRAQLSSVRFGNVLGSRGSVVPIFRKQIACGGPVTVTHPEVERFLMTIPEAARLLIQAGTLGASGEVFILEMGEPVGIRNLARELIELSGLRPGKDVEIKITHLEKGEKLSEELLDDATERLRPTRYDKIAVVEGARFDVPRFEQKLSAIEDAARRGAAQDIVRILRELDIGFHPADATPAPSNGHGRPKSAAAVTSVVSGTP